MLFWHTPSALPGFWRFSAFCRRFSSITGPMQHWILLKLLCEYFSPIFSNIFILQYFSIVLPCGGYGWICRNHKFFYFRKNVPDYSASREKNDLGFLTFDLQTDLTPLFNWNVKQLFLYLTAEYETEANHINQVTGQFLQLVVDPGLGEKNILPGVPIF